MQVFDPLNMPLVGRQLVEAGAGTGKTWSLSLLVVRMALGDIAPDRTGDGAGIEQILVLTYTRAATAELKTRIRDRLRLARLQLEGAVREGHADFDPTLAEVLARVPREAAVRRLENALRRMDEAAISTIHGFCQRLVQEHALEAGLPLDLEVLPDEAALREEEAADFWRRRFYPADAGEARLAAAHWSGPAALLAAVAPTLALDEECVLPHPAADAVEKSLADLRAGLADLRATWAAEHEAILSNVADADCWKKDSPCHPDAMPATLAALAALLEGPEPRFPCPLPEVLAKLPTEPLTKTRKVSPKACQVWEAHEFFGVFERFWGSYQAMLDAWKIAVLHEARAFIRSELPRRKLERGCFGYDDMLMLAARALADPETGPRLTAALRRRYRAVFVDEFQDSDPVQYRIFDVIAREPDFPLVMIGDPKQAIYAFRGGDIFTYLRAREACPENGRHTMLTNQRSAPKMVAAINALFCPSERERGKPSENGRRDNPFLFREILFRRATASGRVPDGGCLLDGAPAFPLNFFSLTREDEGAISQGQADDRAAAVCAGTIRRLLVLATAGRATIDQRPLLGSDIAVLTADHRQAELMRRALGGCGIPSVYMGRVSVFATPEAAETECLLRALLNPQDRHLCAEALNTALFGMGVAELAAGAEEPERLSQALRDLRELDAHWRREGVGPMLHRLFRARRLVGRLSPLPDGERRLTNFLHLAELLDEEESREPGRERLLRRLERLRREAGESGAEEQLLRLESDRDLVRISTTHGAKGLEYPLVFLPFLWRSREYKEGGVVTFHDEDKRALADFRASKANVERAETEERAEAMRRLYVALTRARYANFICWGRVKGMMDTPLADLLHGQAPEDEAALRNDLAALNDTGEGVLSRVLPPGETPWPGGEEGLPASEAAPFSARRFTGEIPQGQGTCSFTGIVSGREPASDMEEKGEDSPAAPTSASPRKDGKFADIADFPRGANPGTCLHRMLELLDFTRPAAEQGDLVAAQLEAHGLDTAWTKPLLPWLAGVLATELHDSRALAGLPAHDRLNELRFHFPLRRLDFSALDSLLTQFSLPPLTAGEEAPPALAERMMTGSIDLVFRHAGRFYIVDYKSNHLGPDATAYDEAALTAAMSRHHYHLQYLIYSVALRRHLRARNRDAEREFGGVYYLFARGMRPKSDFGIYHTQPDPKLLQGFERLLEDGEIDHAG